MMWVWIVVANLIYLVLQDQGFTIRQIIPDAVVLMFILNELVSLGENSAKLGVDMPTPVKKANYLYEQGRTRPGQVVTWIRNSNHTSRRAWDIAVAPPRNLYDISTLSKVGQLLKSWVLNGVDIGK